KRIEQFLRPERLGQTVASLCWIVSVLVYGISAAGDWLQLCAASAWFFSNLAAVITIDTTAQPDSLGKPD
ncbi:MAG: hypothetical protein F6K31_32440, partial [Symploca sp. SIO2G7]|nr:hypothetical protein [Symploca sp. SIO2G7]